MEFCLFNRLLYSLPKLELYQQLFVTFLHYKITFISLNLCCKLYKLGHLLYFNNFDFNLIL